MSLLSIPKLKNSPSRQEIVRIRGKVFSGHIPDNLQAVRLQIMVQVVTVSDGNDSRDKNCEGKMHVNLLVFTICGTFFTMNFSY